MPAADVLGPTRGLSQVTWSGVKGGVAISLRLCGEQLRTVVTYEIQNEGRAQAAV